MKINHFIAVLFVSLLVVSCGNNNENRSITDFTSAFVNNNEAVAVFGKIEFNQILGKADYKSVPKFGNLIESQLNEFRKVIDTDVPICFAIEGPFSEKGVPAAFYAFIDVKSVDSLEQNLTQKGYDFEKDGDMNYTRFGELSLGIEGNLAILISKSGNYDSKKDLASAFEQANGDVEEGKATEILNEKGDVVVGLDIESIYSTSNTQLAKLSSAKKKELDALVANSYSRTTFKFEDGAAIIETKNYFSEALKKRMFLKANEKAVILEKLGHGSPRLGFSLNFDMVKLQQLVTDFSPEALNRLGEQLGGPVQMALMMGGENALSGLLNGELGVVMLGEPKGNGSVVPDFNAYVGFGDKGKSLADMAKSFLSGGTMLTDINTKGMSFYSSANFAPVSGKKLKFPEGCENFGKKALTGFINFEGMDVSSLELEGGAKILNIIKYINFEMDENGGKIVIKAKEGKENILKQSMQFFLKEFESQIGAI